MPTTTDPTTGDNANRSLQKINQVYFEAQAAPANLAPSHGDSAALSLRKINALLVGGAGGGGGGGSDPNAVQKTGDTMTGSLIVGWTAAGNQYIRLDDPVNGRNVTLGPNVVTIREGAVVNLGIGQNGTLALGKGIDMVAPGTAETLLSIDATTGDLIATCTYGPNAGKSVNLTAGKWA